MINRARWLAASRMVAMVVVVASMSLPGVAQAATITPDSVNAWQHIVDCWGAMLHDPDAHQAYCGPGMPVSNSGLATPLENNGHPAPPDTCSGDLGRPAFETYDVASLDEAIGIPNATRKGPAVLLATPCEPSCAPCANSAQRDSGPFDTVRVASLDDEPDAAPRMTDAAHTMLMGCCPAGN